MSGLRPVGLDTDEQYLGVLGPVLYDLHCDKCGAVVAALDMSTNAPVPLRDALEERLLAEHVCVDELDEERHAADARAAFEQEQDG